MCDVQAPSHFSDNNGMKVTIRDETQQGFSKQPPELIVEDRHFSPLHVGFHVNLDESEMIRNISKGLSISAYSVM